MKTKLFIISILLALFVSCDKDNDLPPPPDICNCTEQVVHRRENGRIVFQNTRDFLDQCQITTVEEKQIADVTITTTISCQRP